MIYIMLVCLTACSKGTKDSEIKENIEDELESVMDSDDEIMNIEILEKNFDKKDSYGLVYAKVVSEMDEIQYIRYFSFSYDYDKEDGWEIETVNEAYEDKWDVVPLAGVNENKITQLLDGINIKINEDIWSIKENNISNVTIVSHNTSLKDNKDVVVVSFTIDDYVMRASGQLTLNLMFDEEWKLDTTDGEDSFVAVEKMECVHNVTNDDLIEEILIEELTYGGTDEEIQLSWSSTEQVILMDKYEISEFVINSEETSSKGMYKCYDCNFTLTKRNVEFDVNAKVEYEYNGSQGWTHMTTSLTPTISSLDIGGDWIGTYTGAPYSGDCVLSINTIDEYGNITGIYSYAPYADGEFGEPGSFYVSGSIDMDTLCINLSPGEWINEPKWSTLTMEISAQLIVTEATMYGSGHECCPFILTRDDY